MDEPSQEIEDLTVHQPFLLNFLLFLLTSGPHKDFLMPRSVKEKVKEVVIEDATQNAHSAGFQSKFCVSESSIIISSWLWVVAPLIYCRRHSKTKWTAVQPFCQRRRLAGPQRSLLSLPFPFFSASFLLLWRGRDLAHIIGVPGKGKGVHNLVTA